MGREDGRAVVVEADQTLVEGGIPKGGQEVIHRLAVVLRCIADVIAPLPGLCFRSTFTGFLVP